MNSRKPFSDEIETWLDLHKAVITDSETKTEFLISILKEKCKHPLDMVSSRFSAGGLIPFYKCECGSEVQPKEFEDIPPIIEPDGFHEAGDYFNEDDEEFS